MSTPVSETNGRTDYLQIDPDREQMVRVEGLKKYFPLYEGILKRKTGEVRAVDDVSFTIPKGDTFGLVGESGSGKTTLGKTMLCIHEPTDGTIEIDGTDITRLSSRELKVFRQNMQMMYQDPTSSLNSQTRVKDIVGAPLKIHDIGTKVERRERVDEMLSIVDLPDEFRYKHPRSLSGGQKQRVGLARTLILNPDCVVLDEPTSALDVSVQAGILSLFEELQDRFDLTYLFISHDLSVVNNVSDWLGVMYLGRLVEVGRAEEIFQDPQHPYTRALISAISTITEADRQFKPPEITLEGEIPDPREKPSGCAFRTRCPKEFDACSKAEPKLYEIAKNHYARCFLHDEEHNPRGPEWR